MRNIFLIIALLGMLSGQCLAVAPVNQKLIDEAQEYGQTWVMQPAAEFLRPWVAYEETVAKLDETAERAYVYTPYLLLAADAQQRTLNGQPVRFRDSERVLGDYAGYLVFSVDLFGGDKSFANRTKAFIKQGNQLIPAYQLLVPPEAAKNNWYPKKPKFGVKCYIYFLEQNVNLQAPLTLVVMTGRQDHNFYFNLPQIK